MHYPENFWGNNGFQELKKHCRTGNEFCNRVTEIMQERAVLEAAYSKDLSKLAVKASKMNAFTNGTVLAVWESIVKEIDNSEKTHKLMSANITEEVVKPLRQLCDTQAKNRKPVEHDAEKALKAFIERKNDQSRSKKIAFDRVKDREAANDLLIEFASKNLEKEILKCKAKLYKSEELTSKADAEFFDLCKKVEQSRYEWEMAHLKSSQRLEEMDIERIEALKDMFSKYMDCIRLPVDSAQQSCNDVATSIGFMDAHQDVDTACKDKGTDTKKSVQYLFDPTELVIGYPMAPERRAGFLKKHIELIHKEIHKELKGKLGIVNLNKVYIKTPKFGGENAVADGQNQLIRANYMLDFLKASAFLMEKALAVVEPDTKPADYHYKDYITASVLGKDKNFEQHVLKLPLEVTTSDRHNEGADYVAPGSEPQSVGSGTEVTRIVSQSSFDDDFDPQPEVLCRCRTLYAYKVTNQYDLNELEFDEGEIINLFYRHETGWWEGELNGNRGFFPGTYVEEI